jgi:hypothetical protein
VTRLGDHQGPLEAPHPDPCQWRLRRAIAEVLHNLPPRSWETAQVWLSMKRRVKRLGLGDSSLARQFAGLIEQRRERLLQVGATEGQLEQLLELYPLVDEAAAEESMDGTLVVKHGCQHCRHFYTSWERRDERDRADSRQKPCLIYGVVPPACLHHETSAACSQCGAPGAKPSTSQSAGRGRDLPLFCDACYSR